MKKNTYRIFITVEERKTGDIAYDCVGFEYIGIDEKQVYENMVSDIRLTFSKDEFSIQVHNITQIDDIPF